MTSQTQNLIHVPAREVVPGDQLDLGGERFTVTNNVPGANRQRYLVMESADGGVLVPEYDPAQSVSVWR